jgi:methanogenic corrinoid protein MtbC1
MVEVGRRWHEGRLQASHEHLATEVLRGLVSRILARFQPRSPKGSVVIATTTGQRHEVGGLLAAAAAAQQQWRSVYLGAQLPAEDIAGAAKQVGAGAVALSFAFRNDAVDDLEEIRGVAHRLAPGTRLLVGGTAALDTRAELVALGATVVADLTEFRSALDDIATAS